MMKEWCRNFKDRIKWEVCNGKDIKFWEDKWVGNVALKCKFLRLFSHYVKKDTLLNLCEVWDTLFGGGI